MRWILDHVGPIVFVVIAISFVRKIRDFWKRMESETEERSRTRRPIGSDDADDVRRVQEIQDEIRRKIAERRGGAPVATRTSSPESRNVPPPIPARGSRPIDPFGGPTRRIFAELERRLQPAPVPVQVPESRRAEVAAEVGAPGRPRRTNAFARSGAGRGGVPGPGSEGNAEKRCTIRP
jgi:hypothetical protein